jgi:Ca2+-binding RTX toxin-like protein
MSTIKGTVKADALSGTSLADILYGLEGNDKLFGLGGDDTLYGSFGNDFLDGGTGVDTMRGGVGDDTYIVNNPGDLIKEAFDAGIDTVRSTVSFSLAGNVENLALQGSSNLSGTGNGLANSITGNDGNNSLFGGAGTDSLFGGLGHDVLDGGTGTDTMRGGLGNDTYWVNNPGDIIKESVGEGYDTVQSAISLALAGNVEKLQLLGTSNLSGTGNGLDNRLIGNDGNNALDGKAGADAMSGGLGDDIYFVDNSADTASEKLDAGTDTVKSSVSFAILGHVENLTLTGTANINGTGNSGINILIGNSGNNLLDGGTAADTLKGAAGDDIYYVNNPADVVFERIAEGRDTIRSYISLKSVANVEELALLGTSNINATGDSGVNILTGNSGNNRLDGQGAADTMAGGLGDDTYFVDNTADIVDERASQGIDTVNSTVSYVLTGNVEKLILAGTADINATGNALVNTLTGNSGANVLDGGLGLDILKGGGGNDTYKVDSAGDQISETETGGVDSVLAAGSYTLSAFVENLTLTGAANINGTGNGLANTLTGNSGNNSLFTDTVVGDGLDGSDSVHGADGADTLYSSEGSHSLDGGLGADWADYSAVTDGISATIDGTTGTVIKLFGTTEYTDSLVYVENIRGSEASDNIQAGHAGTARGAGGDDTLSDFTVGDGLFAKLYGDLGTDTLTASSDGGYLDGGGDDDLLVAEAGNQRVIMIGGTGSDQFQVAFEAGAGDGVVGSLLVSANIKGFVDGVDHLVFEQFGDLDTAQEFYDLLVADSELSNEGNTLHISQDGTISDTVIEGLTTANFGADDIFIV